MEIWVDIIGYEGLYQVSDMGRIKVVGRIYKDKMGRTRPQIELIKKCPINHRGYNRAQLTNSAGEKKIFSVHRLVAAHFIPNPDNLPEVNHKCGIKTDNRASQIEWCDKAYNERHASENGLKLRGNKSPKSILDEMQVLTIKQCLIDGIKQKDLSKYFRVSIPTISSINRGHNWRWLSL